MVKTIGASFALMGENESPAADRLVRARRGVAIDAAPSRTGRRLVWCLGAASAVLSALTAAIVMLPHQPPPPARIAVKAPEAPATPAQTPPTARLSTLTLEEPQADAPMVAIVIDDVGLEDAAARRAMMLPASVTLAILPYAAEPQKIDVLARSAGHETFVHLPMEPRGLDDPGTNALYTWLTDEEMRARTRVSFAMVPGASGLNNHMGSRFTACMRCVAVVAEEARAAGLLVLDSLTTQDSALARAAQTAGATTLRRDVFLDNERDTASIFARLAEAEDIARSRGWAVAIGHPADETLTALEAWIPEAQKRGVVVTSAGAVAERLASAPIARAEP